MSSGLTEPIHNVFIIGSGPAGYTAAIYTARADLAPLAISGSVTAGGELMNTNEVENFPGFTECIMGPDLIANMQQQAERFGAEILLDDVTDANYRQAITAAESGCVAALDLTHFLAAGQDTVVPTSNRTPVLV